MSQITHLGLHCVFERCVHDESFVSFLVGSGSSSTRNDLLFYDPSASCQHFPSYLLAESASEQSRDGPSWILFDLSATITGTKWELSDSRKWWANLLGPLGQRKQFFKPQNKPRNVQKHCLSIRWVSITSGFRSVLKRFGLQANEWTRQTGDFLPKDLYFFAFAFGHLENLGTKTHWMSQSIRVSRECPTKMPLRAMEEFGTGANHKDAYILCILMPWIYRVAFASRVRGFHSTTDIWFILIYIYIYIELYWIILSHIELYWIIWMCIWRLRWCKKNGLPLPDADADRLWLFSGRKGSLDEFFRVTNWSNRSKRPQQVALTPLSF